MGVVLDKEMRNERSERGIVGSGSGSGVVRIGLNGRGMMSPGATGQKQQRCACVARERETRQSRQFITYQRSSILSFVFFLTTVCRMPGN